MEHLKVIDNKMPSILNETPGKSIHTLFFWIVLALIIAMVIGLGVMGIYLYYFKRNLITQILIRAMDKLNKWSNRVPEEGESGCDNQIIDETSMGDSSAV